MNRTNLVEVCEQCFVANVFIRLVCEAVPYAGVALSVTVQGAPKGTSGMSQLEGTYYRQLPQTGKSHGVE